ncbi:MAG TPA: XisH family protein, partial [Pyrinomonadaceae bacterium]|nr:XisH family protein [Pyrinomonadaceae bacterium]
MPAKDLLHDCVKNALVKDGWKITDDPFRLKYKGRKLYVDLGAERILAAEKGSRKIAVEIKSFAGHSEMNDLENALGQFIFYRAILSENEPDRELFLAVPDEIFQSIFQNEFHELLTKYKLAKVFGVNEEREEIV